MLLAIATIVASVSAQSRGRARKAIEAAERAGALRDVAHAALHYETRLDVFPAAATALNRIFRAPAEIFIQSGSDVEVVAAAGGARPSKADFEAARGAISTGIRTRGETYPHVQSCLDLWPVWTATGDTFVLAVDFANPARERPELSDAIVETIAGYLASGAFRGAESISSGGSIFMTGSIASVKGWPDYSVYSASKAALRSFARTWLNELKDRGIRVNVLSPGQIATPIQEQLFDEETKRQFESLIPRKRMGRPEEIATVALFLASDDSTFVNGVELAVDGGTSVI